MSTIHLRDRLDRLLSIVENGNDLRTRGLVGFILDILPPTMVEIQKQILVVDKPNIKKMMGKTGVYRKDKAVRELQLFSAREDIFGQICDLILRISLNTDTV